MDEQPDRMPEGTTTESPETTPSDNTASQPGQKNKRTQIIILVIVVLIAAGIGLWLWLASDSDNDQAAQTTVEEQTEVSTVGLENTTTVWTDELVAQIEAYGETNNNVTYVVTAEAITVQSNGLPDHETGTFPNEGNPNTISEQDHQYTVTRTPTYTGTPTDVRLFGVTLGGIPFEPGTAERDAETGWSIEAFNTELMLDLGIDLSNAHVQPDGTYHYHGIPEEAVSDDGTQHSGLVGFAADGFPVYARYGYSDPADPTSEVYQPQSSWQLKQGQRGAGEPAGSYTGDYTDDFEFVEGSGDLDQCNGIFTVTPEFPNGTYAYFLTESFPFVPRCVMGTPDDSFVSVGPGLPPQQGGQQGQQPPQGNPPTGGPPPQ